MKTKTIPTLLATACVAMTTAQGASVLLGGFDGDNTYEIPDGSGGFKPGAAFQAAGDKYIRDPHQSTAATTAGFTAELYMANNVGKEMQWTSAGTNTGIWGSSAQGPFTPAPTTANNSIYTLDQNSGTGTLEFRVTNGGADNITLEYLYFAANPASSGSTEMTVAYASGDLTASGGGSTVVSYASSLTSYAGYDVDLTSILSDNVLGAGETATFTLVTASGLTNRFHVDNVGMSGSISAVPEPSSAALLGLGGLALILRRRK